MKQTSPAAKPKHPNAIGIKEAFGYLFGDMGNLLNLTFISTYLKVFYTDCLLPGHGASAAKISTDLTVLFLVILVLGTQRRERARKGAAANA